MPRARRAARLPVLRRTGRRPTRRRRCSRGSAAAPPERGYPTPASARRSPQRRATASARRGARRSSGSARTAASAASRAAATQRASRSRSAIRRSGSRPCWRVPRNSPGPRMRRSASAMRKPSCVSSSGAEPRLAVLGGAAGHEQAGARARAAPDPPAQLVELREAEALGVLDDHQRRAGHVDADLDHRGRDEDPRRAASKRSIDAARSAATWRPWTRSTRAPGEGRRDARGRLGGGAQVRALALLDERVDHVRLLAPRRGSPAAAASRARPRRSGAGRSRRACGREAARRSPRDRGRRRP